MNCHDTLFFCKPRRRVSGLILLVVLIATASFAGADGPADKASSMEAFRKLSPAERRRFLADAGVGNAITQKVVRGVLSLEVVERGSLEAVRTSYLACPLNNVVAGIIKWVADEGTAVKKGDKVIEFDDAPLQDALKIRVGNLAKAQTAFDKAKDALKVAQEENAIAIRLAEITVELAELTLKQDKEANRDLTRSLQLKVEQAQLGLKLVKLNAPAKEAGPRNDLAAKAAKVNEAASRKKEIETDLGKCVLRAPHDGMLIYFVPERGGFGGGPITAQGEPVRKGQKLLIIADLAQMQVRTRIPENLVHLVHGVDAKDAKNQQAAQVRVDAYPMRSLKGVVNSVDRTASSNFSGTKVYGAVVSMESPAEQLRPGMSAEVRITVKQTPAAVLQAPAESVMTIGKKRFCYVMTDKEVQEREVVIGLSADRLVEIQSGLQEGESVLRSPEALIRRLAKQRN